MTYVYTGHLQVETCCAEGCGVTFGLNQGHYQELLRNKGRTFYCPNGHAQHYTGKSYEQKLRDAEARETALRDQLSASIREQDLTRQTLLRERARFANGVCPCCTRSFENVRRHMKGEHPDYPLDRLRGAVNYECSCGASFESYRGLRVHQGKSRSDEWDKPGQWEWRAHLTVIAKAVS